MCFFFPLLLRDRSTYVSVTQRQTKSISEWQRKRARERYLPEKKNTYAIFGSCVFFSSFRSFDVVVFLFFELCMVFFLMLLFVFAIRSVDVFFFFFLFFHYYFRCVSMYVHASRWLRMCAFCDALFLFQLDGFFSAFILIRIYELDYSMENKKRIRKKAAAAMEKRRRRRSSTRICIKCGGWMR